MTIKLCSKCKRETWQHGIYTRTKGVWARIKDMTRCDNCGMILFKGQALELFGPSGQLHTYTIHSEIIDHEPEEVQHQMKYEGDECVQFVTQKEHKHIHKRNGAQT